jgi:hypothetical protein
VPALQESDGPLNGDLCYLFCMPRAAAQCATLLLQAPHAADALRAHGNSALWASLGAQTPEEVRRVPRLHTVRHRPHI